MRLAGVVVAVSASAMLAGCIASPTYGTDRTANEQLLDDITSVFSIGTGQNQQEIAYNPRPELVRPASLEVLPAPQTNVAAGGNPQWPESPEQRLARIRAEATENQNNPAYRSPVQGTVAAMDGPPRIGLAAENPQAFITADQRAEFNRRLAIRNQGSQTSRRFLSEPPLDYRAPAETAPVDDVGEDEWRKERRLERQAGKGTSWRDFIPWL